MRARPHLWPYLVVALLDVQGYLAARGVNASGPESWRDGDRGQLELGGDRNAFGGAADNEDAGLVEAAASAWSACGVSADPAQWRGTVTG